MKTVSDILESTAAHSFVSGPAFAKATFTKNRHIEVRYCAETDTFNIRSYTLRGGKATKEKRFEGVVVSDLKRLITKIAPK